MDSCTGPVNGSLCRRRRHTRSCYFNALAPAGRPPPSPCASFRRCSPNGPTELPPMSDARTAMLHASGGAPPLELLSMGPAPPAFLLVHGSSCRAATYLQLMRALAERGIGTAAVSLRGHGGSGGHAELQEASIFDFCDDVGRALDAIAAAGPLPILVGHSMGGLITQLLAASGRFALPGIVLLASSPVGGMRSEGPRMIWNQPWAFLKAMWYNRFSVLYEDPRACRWLLFSPDTPEETIREHQAAVGEESSFAAKQMNTVMPEPSKVPCPVLVVGGDCDNMVSAPAVERTAAAYGVETVWLKGKGHMVQTDGDPGDLADALAAFRDSIVGGRLRGRL
ncbi:Alpha/Beta hydrolase protein [Hyaloraphidium curvatum]|nr:Alpha/Beta hydrolase protein [Hyaloraphidium curvatum]